MILFVDGKKRKDERTTVRPTRADVSVRDGFRDSSGYALQNELYRVTKYDRWTSHRGLRVNPARPCTRYRGARAICIRPSTIGHYCRRDEREFVVVARTSDSFYLVLTGDKPIRAASRNRPVVPASS